MSYLARLVPCLALIGCADAPAEPRVIHGDTGWVQYKPNARFLEEEPGYRSVEIESRDDGVEVLTFRFDAPPDVTLVPGDVVIGVGAPHYFRKVVSAEARGSDLVVVTAVAALRDAVEEADISAFVPYAAPDEVAPVLAAPVSSDAPPMRPRPGVEELYGSVASALSEDFYTQRTVTPFNLANRNLLALPFGSFPLSIKTSAESYLKLRGGYSIRIVISGDDVYFRTEGRAGYDLNYGVTIKGNLWEQGISVGLDTGKLGSFSVLGISGSLTFDIDAVAAGPIEVPSLTVGKHVGRDATAWVRYDSTASTKWASGGSLTTNAVETYENVEVSDTTAGHIRFGIRSKVGVSLSATLDTPGIGSEVTSSVSTTLTPQLDIDITPGHPAKWDLDACLRATASVSNKVSTFLNPAPGFDFDNVEVVGANFAKTWTLYSDCWNVVGR